MSSLQRTRSLRKPTNPSSLPADSAPSAPRSVSPSRLPLKPATRPRPRPLSIHGSATTASSNTTTTTTASAATTTTNTSRTTRSASTQLARTTSLSQKQTAPPPAQDPTKKDSRYAPLRTATRSASGGSTTRPTSAGGPGTRPARAPIPTHTRAKSTVTSLSAATALRPLSRDVSASLKRGHGRSVSVDKASSCTTPIRQQQQHQREKQPCSPTTAVASKPHLRPAFSTLQQHYSPAKTQAPKPLTSAILAPPSPSKLPANIAASAVTSKLQAELLQLHLLHRDAGAVYTEWQASAEDTLRSRFHDLKVESGEVAERERSVLEGENMLALRQWARGGGAGKDLEGRIQLLDEIVTSLWVLSEPAGRYARLVRRFERFVDRACDAEDARGSSLGDAQGEEEEGALDRLFVEELDAGWKGEVAILTRRLEMWKGQFQSIDDFVGSGTGIAVEERGSSSALERMLEGVRGLLQGMLDELYAMEEMEALVLAREEAWIERVNMREEERQEREVEAGAIWRVL
ncbi:hypothetical protein E4U19_002111 [Claviceps sp. Clav32 group G5]|nr:hypothetical protein E4U19_002111 [Claviceps sp. Clav32 group G5]